MRAFAASGLAEQGVERPVGRDARRHAHAQALGLELPEGDIRFRLVRGELPGGTVEILATSLLDAEAYPAAEFADLYHGRWNIEIYQPYNLHKSHRHSVRGGGPAPLMADGPPDLQTFQFSRIGSD